MERKKASDFPPEVLKLFDGYVHGTINRREFLDRSAKFAVGGFTAAAMLESLKPNFAWAQQVAKDDARIRTESLTYASPEGSGTMRGYYARPAKAAGKLPGVTKQSVLFRDQIGHGLGLEVHEHPNFRLQHEPPDVLQSGHVVAIEPGLYYPERGFGVRVEDTVWISPDGPQVLAPYPMDLVLPLRRSRRASAKNTRGKSTLGKNALGTKKTRSRPVRRTRGGG